MEFNFSDVWGTLKSPSLGFVTFIMLCIFLLKIKDIIDILEIIKTRKINNLKMLRDELILTKGEGSCEKKLLDNVIEMEMIKLSLGVSNRRMLPLFSYLATKINFQTLLITKKCIDYIDPENLSIDAKGVSKRFWTIVSVCIAVTIYFILALINEETAKIEMQWLLMSIVIFIIAGAIWTLNKLPGTTEIKRMNEVLGDIDKNDYLKYKNEIMNTNEPNIGDISK